MKQDRRIQNLKRRALSTILSTVMAASLVPALATTGLAADAVGTFDSPTLEKLAANMCMGDKVFDFPDGEEQTARLMAEQFPERFDLRSADLDGDGEPENLSPPSSSRTPSAPAGASERSLRRRSAC